MTFKMQVRLERWGSWSDVNLPFIGAGDFHFQPAYSHPAVLTWTCLVPQHTAPIPPGAWIRFWEEGQNDPAGTPFSATNPLFLGRVDKPEPGDDSNRVSYTASDPTKDATKRVKLFNTPYLPGEIPDTPPTAPEDGVPRFVANVNIEADPDYAFQVQYGKTVGETIQTVLEFCYQPLYWLDAAPGDGTNEGNDVPYLSSDLTGHDFAPQEKLDYASESPRGCMERLQRYDPRYRLLWDPKTKRWRIHNITTAPAITLTLNTLDSKVIGLQIKPATDHCITALTIYGPPTSQTKLFDFIDVFNRDPSTPTTTTNGLLIPISDPEILETYVSFRGIEYAMGYRKLQIQNPADRQGSAVLPEFYTYNLGPSVDNATEYPRVLISFDGGSTWVEWDNCHVDTFRGIITFASIPKFVIESESGQPVVPGSTQTIFTPNVIRLIYAPLEPPLKVRVPTSGYEGTAYTVATIDIEDHRNDEQLSIGREHGIPVTSTQRRAQMTKFAQAILDQRKDIVWTGVVILDGIDYRFCRLNKRINFEAEDGSGNPVTTGWEDIDAYVTDADYDFENQTTTLMLSSDRMEAEGDDPEFLKQRLGIRALTQRNSIPVWTLAMTGSGFAIVQANQQVPTFYEDPVTGEQHHAQG